MSDEDAVNEELAARDVAPDDAPWTLGFVVYVFVIGLVVFLAVRYGVWVLIVGGTLTVLGYAWVFGTHRKDGAR